MHRRHIARYFAAAIALAVVSCAGGTGSTTGCGGGCIEPLPGGFTGTRAKDAIVARISKDGFTFLNSKWQTLAVNLVPGAKLVNGEVQVPFAVPCTPIADPGYGVGDMAVCDSGVSGPGSTGFMDGKCDGNDSPCPIMITLQSLGLDPQSPNKLALNTSLKLDVLRDINNPSVTCKNSGTSGCGGCNWLGQCNDCAKDDCNIYVASATKTSACALTKRMGCFMNFYSDRQGRSNEVIGATIEFGLDQKWYGANQELLTFDIPNGVSGIDQIESGDIKLGGTDRCKNASCSDSEDMCDYACSLLGTSFIKDMIIKFAKPTIDQKVKEAIAAQRCRACDAQTPCPTGSNCSNGVCMASGACVPRLLGMEGRLNPFSVLGNFGVDSKSRVDIFAAAGGSLTVGADDFQVGLLGGAKAPAKAACVPDLPAPARRNAPTPDLNAEGPAGHHVGLGVSEYFLDLAMYESHRAGALCLNLSTQGVSLLTTGLFKTFLPSLGTIAGTDTKDAPMMVVLRPMGVPDITIGEGTFDPVTKKPLKPLLTLALKDLNIDFYALIEDRQVRLFTLTADVSVPLSLIVEGCPQTVTPALGDLKQLITNIRTSNSELLAEDPQALAQLIPAVLGMAEPALAGALKPIALPDMNGFRIKIIDDLNKRGIRGINPIAGATGEYNHLGLFASILLAGQCASYGPETQARIVATHIPAADEMKLVPGRALPWPSAIVEVDALDIEGNGRAKEYAYRVDGGLWSTWFDGPRLEVSHPAFLMQGKHDIEIRARIAGESEMVDPTPVKLEFLVDWDAPTVKLVENEKDGRIDLLAKDNVTPAAELIYAYRLGDEPLGEFGPARPIDLAAVSPFGRLEVHVKDVAGNESVATWRAPKLGGYAADEGEGEESGSGGMAARFGCSAGGGELLGLGWLFSLAALARRRRS